MLFFIKLYLQILQRVAPRRAVRTIYRFVSTPKGRALKDTEAAVIDDATQSTIPFESFSLQRYEWNPTGKTLVMLVHGWEGRAGNFASIIPELVRQGHRVIAFDAPGHGDSSKGDTHMFHFGTFLAEQLAQLRPTHLVSHSFGSVSLAMALNENTTLPITRWLLITTPHTFQSRMAQASALFGINASIMRGVEEMVEGDTGVSILDLDMVKYCRRFDHVQSMLIVHSVADKVIPIEWSRAVQDGVEQCSLIELQGHGHYSILWSSDLLQIVQREFSVQPL